MLSICFRFYNKSARSVDCKKRVVTKCLPVIWMVVLVSLPTPMELDKAMLAVSHQLESLKLMLGIMAREKELQVDQIPVIMSSWN